MSNSTQVACFKKVASLLFCALVAVVVGCCLLCPVVVVDAAAVAWYVDGATLVDWGSGSLVVSNATDFQLLNSNISATKLELQLASMAELALRPPLPAGAPYSVVSLTIRNTTFFANSQLWIVGGSNDGGVRFDVLVEGCTFSESLFSLMDLWVAHGSRFRFINNRMTRTTSMGGSTNLLHNTHALWEQNVAWKSTVSILFLLHNVTVADRSDFLIQDSSFEMNVPGANCIGMMSTGGVVVEDSSTWNTTGLKILASSGASHAYGMVWWESLLSISNNSSYSISRCNVNAYSVSYYAYGMRWSISSSSTITSNYSTYSISDCNVTGHSGSSYAYGMSWYSSSSIISTNCSTYSISGCNVTAHSDSSIAFGMYWQTSSSTIITNYSTYSISGCNVTGFNGGSLSARGMYWHTSSSTIITNFSTYSISDCTVTAYNIGSSSSVVGMYWYTSSATTSNYATYSINRCTVTAYNSESAYAVGMYWYSSSSKTTTTQFSTYSISGCNVTAYNSGSAYAVGLRWHSSATTITTNYSTYSISGCNVTASNSVSTKADGMYWTSSGTLLSSGSVFRLDTLVFGGGINQLVLGGMSFQPTAPAPLGFYLSSNEVLVDQDIGVALSGSYRHSRCNRKVGSLLPGQTEPCNDTSCGSLPMHCHPQFAESSSFSNGRCVCSCKNATQLLAITAPPTIPTIESAEWLASLLDSSCYPLIVRLPGRRSVAPSLILTPSRTNSHLHVTRTSSSTRTNVESRTATRNARSVSATSLQSRTSHRSTTAEHDTVRIPSVSFTLNRDWNGKLDDQDSTHSVEDSAQPPTASDTVSTVAQVLGSETAAKAVVGTGSASVAVAGLVTSPAGASQAVRLGAIAGALTCSYTDDDVIPSLFEHPFQLSLGDGPLKVYVGSTLLSTLLFIAMPWLVLGAVWLYGFKVTGDLSPKLLKVQSTILSNFSLVSLAYMGPVMCKSFVLVVAHDPTATDVAVVCVCFLVTLCAVAVVAWAVFRGGKTNSTGGEEDDNAGFDDEASRAQQVFGATFGLLFAGCRNLSAPVRACYLVEVGCTSLLMVLDGIRPGKQNCSKVAAAMASVSLILLLYFCIARPFRARLELFFVIATSTLLFVLGVLAYLSNLLRDEVTLQPPEWALTAFGYVAVAESIAFFLQAAVLAAWAYTRAQRRKVLRRQAEVERARGGGNGNPLLGDVPMAVLNSGGGAGTSGVKVPAGTTTGDSGMTGVDDDAQQSMLSNPLLQPI